MRRELIAVTALIILIAGCNTGGVPSSPTTTVSPATQDFRSSGVPCSDELEIGFWGLNEEQFWDQDVVRVTYTIPSNLDVLLVTYVDGTVSGVDSPNSGDHADGASLELNSTYSGKHIVRVIVFEDNNENRILDANTDSPCLNDGDVVQAGPKEIDFSRFA